MQMWIYENKGAQDFFLRYEGLVIKHFPDRVEIAGRDLNVRIHVLILIKSKNCTYNKSPASPSGVTTCEIPLLTNVFPLVLIHMEEKVQPLGNWNSSVATRWDMRWVTVAHHAWPYRVWCMWTCSNAVLVEWVHMRHSFSSSLCPVGLSIHLFCPCVFMPNGVCFLRFSPSDRHNTRRLMCPCVSQRIYGCHCIASIKFPHLGRERRILSRLWRMPSDNITPPYSTLYLLNSHIWFPTQK